MKLISFTKKHLSNKITVIIERWFEC